MKIEEIKETCSGCNACQSKCPKNAIKFIENKEGFYYPQIDLKKCINCKICEKVCPILNQEKSKAKVQKYYAFSNGNDIIRNKSASGGFFTAVSKIILKNNGVIYGCILNGIEAKIIRTTEEKDLEKIRSSKYVASENIDYNLVKKDLEDGKEVLYSGLPCYITGLQKFLGKEYDNLYTMEILCLGVPSPKVFKKYINNLEEKNKSKVKNINFRFKKYNEQSSVMRIDFVNSNKYEQPLETDFYLKVFHKGLMMREPCYNCKFKEEKRKVDFRIGDLWNYKSKKSKTLVICGSQKSIDLIKELNLDNEIIEIEKFEDAILYNGNGGNSAINKTKKINSKREEFFKDIDKINFKELKKKYAKITLKQRIKKILKDIIYWRNNCKKEKV